MTNMATMAFNSTSKVGVRASTTTPLTSFRASSAAPVTLGTAVGRDGAQIWKSM